MVLNGGCLCGAVRYRLSAPPTVVTHCHCRTCRRATGAPFVTWLTAVSESFEFTAGKLAVFHSSPDVSRGFCVTCGTTLTYQHDSYTEELDIAVATLDDPTHVTPQDHIWVGTMLPWLKFADDLPRLPGSHWDHGYPASD